MNIFLNSHLEKSHDPRLLVGGCDAVQGVPVEALLVAHVPGLNHVHCRERRLSLKVKIIGMLIGHLRLPLSGLNEEQNRTVSE